MNTEDLEVSLGRLSEATEALQGETEAIREGLDAVANSIDGFTEAFKTATDVFFNEWVRRYKASRGGSNE